MTLVQRTRQQQACHIRFKQLQGDGVAPVGLTVHDYARQVCGRPVDTLKQLEDWELNALRDRLEGKKNKALEKLIEVAAQAGIGNLDAWIRGVDNSPSFAFLRGHTAETLPMASQWRLARCLSARRNPTCRNPSRMTNTAPCAQSHRNEPTLF